MAVCDALSALCDAVEFVTPEQLLAALDQVTLLGVAGDAEIAAK